MSSLRQKKKHQEEDENDEEISEENEDYDEEISNEDDDEEDYDEDSETRNKKRKRPDGKRRILKKRKKEIGKFFEDYAEEASEEDDISPEGSDSENERVKREKKNLPNIQLEPKKNRFNLIDMTQEQIEERYNQMDKSSDSDGINYHDLPANIRPAYEISQLPTLKDPKVFAVKCREGMERDSVLKLIHKFSFLLGKKNQEMNISSASSIDKFPGWVYIESKNEVNVRNAINDIDGLMFGPNSKITIIPIKEVPLIYTIDETKQIKIKKGQFVRIKKGLYTGDLAKVTQIDMNDTTMVKVKVVPRLQQGEKSENIKYNASNIHLRPVKQISKPGAGDQETGHLYVNGLLEFKIRTTNLIIKDIVPTLEEIDYFVQGELEENRQAIYEEMMDLIEITKKNINKFQKGDSVRVIEGSLSNLTGVVINTNDKEVTVLPNREDFNQTLTFQPYELIKNFQIGDLVKTNVGRNEGKSGRVIKIEGSIATILMNNQKEQFRSFLNDLVKSNEVQSDVPIANTNENAFFDYKKYDLVKLMGHDSAGLVLKVDKDSLTIMNDKGNVKNISYFEVESKVAINTVNFQNNYKDNVTVQSTVKVLDGLYKGKIGTVKHIFKDVLFLFNQEFSSTGGIFVEKGNNCYLINTNINNKPIKSAYNSVNANPNQEEQQKPKKGKDPLLGQVCIVIKGPWKGFEGVVKDADDKTVRIELSAKAKILTVTRDIVRNKNNPEENIINESDRNNVMEQYGKTPAYTNKNSFSPFHGGQSPGYMASPGWG